MPPTHEVANQVPPLGDVDTAADPALLEALHREGAGWAEAEVHAAGRLAGSEQAREWGRLANEYPPVLRTHDRVGHRIDEVEFHPAWHELLGTAVRLGLTAGPWQDDRPGAHAAHAATSLAWTQVEAGHMCPVGMTYAAVPTLRHAPDLAAVYEPLLAARTYEPGSRPPAQKQGLLAGMSMTEKQGGSDVRTNTTRAVPAADGTYRLTGHKWFTSAPMCDVFLVLAQAPGGMSCFLLPRILPDGSRNRMYLQRLKDKLGNRSNASAELEYDDAVAWLVGEEGDGLRLILEMVDNSRLAVTVWSAAGMRAATVAAVRHATHRKAFGAYLHDQPLMRNVLADLALESEAATALVMRIAGATDRAVRGDDNEAAFRRIAGAVGEYWVCKRTPAHAGEALECLGGNGYVEDSGIPRLYREAPLNSVWEGSGNVIALDVLRALHREPESVVAFVGELDAALGADRHYDSAVARLRSELAAAQAAGPGDPAVQFGARRLAEQMALTLQASLLLRHGHPAVADGFCASRLAGDRGHTFGALPAGADVGPLIERALLKAA
ncbi:acyl-CoA dehydrogenase family protein [Pseudonocardia sp. CA-142604]|uniref:acyl-CoA dehydrogenase family protein n=1 Tax=Pseudonocardia sp. CA-142604 TaxID=3240024 RepID=UPI003D943466